jgi:hypothetical protein
MRVQFLFPIGQCIVFYYNCVEPNATFNLSHLFNACPPQLMDQFIEILFSKDPNVFQI